MGKSLLKGVAIFLAMFVAGLLYMEWGSFEYTVPADRHTAYYMDGSPRQ
jgi:hypothetical protein